VRARVCVSVCVCVWHTGAIPTWTVEMRHLAHLEGADLVRAIAGDHTPPSRIRHLHRFIGWTRGAHACTPHRITIMIKCEVSA
jgi:hypothetical protein